MYQKSVFGQRSHLYEGKLQLEELLGLFGIPILCGRQASHTIKELTPFHTIVLLDSGKEITFLNNSVLSGAVAIAKITHTPTQTKDKTSPT